jgi:antitoxin HicB
VVEIKKLPAAFYCTAAGREPVREWLKDLDEADRRTIGQDIATAEFGWPVGMPVCGSLGNGLYEIRSDISHGADNMSAGKKKGRIGSSFSAFMKDEGLDQEASAVAIKRVLAWQLENAMAKEGVTKNEMARRMRTSRSQLERILDPDNDKIQLDTVFKAARVLGRELKLELV